MTLLLLALPLAALVAVGALTRLARRGGSLHLREHGMVTAARGLGILAGVASAGAAVSLEPEASGRGAALAPAVFGLVALLFVVVAETLVRPVPVAGPRRASLVSRRVRDYAPRSIAVPVVVACASLTLVLTLTTLTASDDDLGRPGRFFRCTADGVSAAHGPYPGIFYSAPLAVVLVLLMALAGAAAHRVVRRPRGYERGAVTDTVLRRRSLKVVLGALLLALCATLAGVALLAGAALRGVQECAPLWAEPVGDSLLVLAALAVLGALWGLWAVLSEG